MLPGKRGSRNFCQGVVQARRPEYKYAALTTFSFHIPQLILQFTDGVQWFYYREYDPTFSRGSIFFQRGGGGEGVKMLISIETHITCDFPWGWSGPPIPPSGPAHAGRDIFADFRSSVY